MSDYHILTSDRYGNSYQVVFHVPIPDQANQAGYSYRTALVEWQGGSSNITSRIPNPGTELTQLQSGELFEEIRIFFSVPAETLLEKRNRLDAMFANVVSDTQARLQAILGYWGYSHDVS